MLDIYFEVISQIIATLVMITNLTEILLLIRRMKTLKTSMIFILNLAISDMLVGTVVVTITIMYYVKVIRAYDLFINLLLNLSMHMSSMNLIAVTADRCLAVIKPIWHRKIKRKFSVIVCIILWIVSTAIFSTLYFLIKFGNHNPKIRWRFFYLTYPIVTLTTTSVLIYGYYTIINKLKLHRRRVMFQMISVRKMTVIAVGKAVEPTVMSAKKKIKSEAKMIKLTAPLILLYVICWIPISIYYIFEAFDKYNPYAFKSLFCIALLNSLLNPILYFHHVRKEMSRAFRSMKNYMRAGNGEKKDNRVLFKSVVKLPKL